MITIEKDGKAEEIFIHATPEDLRELAKKLWAISEKADTKGKHQEQFTAKPGADVELASKPRLGNNGIVKKLTISSSLG